MTLKTCIELVDKMAPNSFDKTIKLRWLSEIEGKLQIELCDRSISELVEYDSDTSEDTKLLIPFPFDQIYWMYLIAMLDFANGDNVHYTNSSELFNTVLDSYSKWLIRNGGIIAAR